MKKLLFIPVIAAVTAITACSGDKETATPPTEVDFVSLTANGSSAETTTALTLTFSQSVAGLTEADIAIAGSNVTKGSLTYHGNGEYVLTITGVTATGSVTVSPAKNGYKFSPSSKTVGVYLDSTIDVNFESATANGSSTQTTTAVMLTFSRDVTGLSADDITIDESNVTKGELTSDGGGVYTLSLDVDATGDITIGIAKAGYRFSPASKTATVYVDTTVYVDFTSLTANGNAGSVTTTLLTLAFSRDITGLAAGDITLSGDGVTKGALTPKGGGVYTLAVEVTAAGDITVAVVKAGYGFTPASKTVAVYFGSSLAVIDYVGPDTATEPSYFTKMTGGGSAYVNFEASRAYSFGCNSPVGNSAVAYNQPLPKPLSSYDVLIGIDDGSTTGISVGYVTSLTDLTTYVQIAGVTHTEGGGPYTVSLSAAAGVPATAYLAVRYVPGGTWHNNRMTSLKVYER